MNILLGIDIGSTTTKIVGMRRDCSVYSMLRVRADDPLTSLYGALGNYLYTNKMSMRDIAQIALTGVGASYIDGDICDTTTVKIDEFSAIGVGALYQSFLQSAVVASIGTGTAFLWAEDGKPVRHLCGSGIGGGTLSGLCSKLAGIESFNQINKLSSTGSLSKVDLSIKDILKNATPELQPDMTAANFGRLAEDATAADLTAGAVNLVLQAIGTMSVLACQCCKSTTVVVTGSLSGLEQAEPTFDLFERLYGIRYIIPRNAPFGTAIGAVMCSLK